MADTIKIRTRAYQTLFTKSALNWQASLTRQTIEISN